MVNEISKNNFAAEVAGPFTVVDFWAPWCGPCKMMSPIVEQLAEKYQSQIKFVKFNVDGNQEIAKRYKVYSIPSLVIFQNGNGIEKITGVYPKEKLVRFFDQKLASD